MNHSAPPSSTSWSKVLNDSPAIPVAALLVDHTGHPVGDEIGVGGDVEPERGDVVAGVGDHGEAVGAEQVEQPAGELRTTGAA